MSPAPPRPGGAHTRRSSREVFPTTEVTLIGRLLAGGRQGRVEAAGHIMSVYARPLRVYLAGSSYRDLGEPGEIVDGFFADRLSREGFLKDWLQSGRRLRHWLIRAFKHYLLEHIRSVRRQRRMPDRYRYEEPNRRHRDDDPEVAFHREAALSVVREAYRHAARGCLAVKLDKHWQAFVRHHIDGQDYRALAAELDVTPARARVMARTAAERFRFTLRDMLAWSGALPDEVDQEIRALMETLAR